MDLNELLVKTTTAAEDSGASSEVWVKGRRKRKRSSQEVQVSSYNRQEPAIITRQDTIGRDMGPTTAEMTRERGENVVSSALVNSNSRSGVLSSSIIACLVIDYMFCRELGGRHSVCSTQNKLSSIHGRARELMVSQLAAERAGCSVVASWAMLHYLPIIQPIGGLRSSVKWENYPDAVVKYRRTLQVCDIRRDLIGGVTAEQTPHFRDFALRILEVSLEGKTPQLVQAQDTAKESAQGRSFQLEKSDLPHGKGAKNCNEVQLSFQTASRSSKDEKSLVAFSIDEFLNPSSASSEED